MSAVDPPEQPTMTVKQVLAAATPPPASAAVPPLALQQTGPLVVAGIDPGLDGALAWIYKDVPEISDVPTLLSGTASKKGKARREYDEQGLRDMLERLRQFSGVIVRGGPPRMLVVIEKQGPMPGQAVQATFSQAHGYGLWKGLLAGLQIPYRVVTPQAWKKALMEGQPRTVEASVAAALRYYPTMRPALVGPKGGLKDGRADALLLARYGSLGLR